MSVGPLETSSRLARPKSLILGCAIGRQQHVGGFQVTVDDGVLMGDVDGAGQQLDQLGGVSRGLRPTGDPVLQVAPFQVFHGEEGSTVMFADFEDLHEVRVLQTTDGFHLSLEPGSFRRRRVPAGQEHLERDQSLRPGLPREEHHPHAAAPELAQDLVAGNAGDIRRIGRVQAIHDREWLVPSVGRGLRATGPATECRVHGSEGLEAPLHAGRRSGQSRHNCSGERLWPAAHLLPEHDQIQQSAIIRHGWVRVRGSSIGQLAPEDFMEPQAAPKPSAS